MLPWRLDGSLCAFGRFSIMRTHIADKQQNNSPPGSEVLKKLILHETSISAGWQKSWLKNEGSGEGVTLNSQIKFNAVGQITFTQSKLQPKGNCICDKILIEGAIGW